MTADKHIAHIYKNKEVTLVVLDFESQSIMFLWKIEHLNMFFFKYRWHTI